MPLVRNPNAQLLFDQPPSGFPPPQTTVTTVDTFEDALGRPPAFPIYLSGTPNPPFEQNVDYEPGRICIAGTGGDENLIRPDIYEVLSPQDVLNVYYYQPYEGPPPFPRHHKPDALMAVLADVGPQINAVVAGQWVAEVGFTPVPDGSPEARTGSVLHCTEFTKEWAGLMRGIDTRPAIGLTIHQLLMHAYWADKTMAGGDPLRKVLIDQDVLVICYMGFAFWGRTGEGMLAVESDHEGRWITQGEIDKEPYPVLKAWLEGPECWGGVDYMPGLRAGNDVRMAAGGFKAGVIGQLPNSRALARTMEPLGAEPDHPGKTEPLAG